MPKPKTKEQYRKDLLDNIKFIKNFVPSFEMTDEQINYMLSDERYEMHCKYYGQNPSDKGISRDESTKKYTPAYPKAFERHVKWFIHDENTEEGREYNRQLLENMGRDDETGLAAQNQYLIKALNAVGDVDMSKMGDDVSLTEFMNYAEQNTFYGKAVMETQHILAEFKNIKPKEASEEKMRAIYNFGTTVGGVLSEIVQLTGNEAFLTLPLEYLNKDQRLLLSNAIAHDKDKSKYGDYLAVMEAFRDSKKNLSDSYANYRKYVKEGEKIGLDDFEENLPKKEIIGGGYEERRKTILQVIKENASYDGFSQYERYQEMVEQGKALKSMIEELGDKVPGKDEQAELSKQAKQYQKAIYDFTKDKGIQNSDDPDVKQNVMNLKNSMTSVSGYSYPNILSANVYYYGVDSGYTREVEHLVKQLKKTEGNLTANSPAYDNFSKLLKGMPEKLNQLKTEKNVTFEKIQEIFKPVVDAAGEYFESHKNVKLNSRQFNRIKIMNRLKDLSKEASQRSGAPGKDIDYRLAEKVYTAQAIKIKSKDLLMNDKTREEGIKNILNSDEFKRDIAGASLDAKEKMLRVPGEKVISKMKEQYCKGKEPNAPENANTKEKTVMKIG